MPHHNRYYEGLFRTAQTLAEQINHLQPPKLPLSIATSKSLSNSGADVAAGNNHGANVDDLKRVCFCIFEMGIRVY